MVKKLKRAEKACRPAFAVSRCGLAFTSLSRIELSLASAHGDALIHTGILRRLLAFTKLKFSNSMIEAWWRSLKHQWLFLHPLDSVTTVRRVAFYVDQHNRMLPHSAFRGQTPDEIYFGTGEAVPADLRLRAAAARRTRVEANR